jgi:hypothetical protein
MGRVCTVCSHPHVDAINRALLSGTTYTMIANTFAVSWQAARYHILKHIPPLLAKAQQAEEAARASDLLTMAMERDQKALALLAKAEAQNDLKTALQALRVSLVSLELLARLRGELNEQQNNTVNLLLAPEYLAARAAMVGALAPFPDAHVAVVAALAQIEGGSSNGDGDGRQHAVLPEDA